MNKLHFHLPILAILLPAWLGAQVCSNLNIQWQADIPSTCNEMIMTMIHDANNLPYLYVANKEAGLKVYDISNINSPTLTATVPTSSFDTLNVMSLTQAGNYLYLALGNSFTNPQSGGMAIVDITNPLAPTVTDYYVVPGSQSGGGIVKTEGNYAYLGAMESGLVILDITDKNNIQFVSQFIPSINFPPVANPNPATFNARGMEVLNSIVYLCYDAGGIRIIDCFNKSSPVETGRWCNPAMYIPMNHPKAYNNCILRDSLLFVAVDYAGMEVLNISDTANISLTGWWNPYNAPNNNWFTSPSHTNEMYYNDSASLVLLSTGKSDMVAIDVADPSQPDSCNFYGGVSNNIATWGIGSWQDHIYLSYICAVIPFSSNWTGVKILTYNSGMTGFQDEKLESNFSIWPNPASTHIQIKLPEAVSGSRLRILDLQGKQIRSFETPKESPLFSLPTSGLKTGVYFIQFELATGTFVSRKILVRH